MSTTPTISPRRCFFCRSRSCHYRIHTAEGDFDEIACHRHHANLEAYANAILGSPGRMRTHTTSSSFVRRAAKP